MEFSSWLEWNQRLIESNAMILVEGKNDARKLAKLGVEEKRVYTVAGRPIYQIVEDLELVHNLIILTDLDSEGRHMYRQLKHHLQREGKKIDNLFRNFLFRNTSVSHIEGLPLVTS